MINGDLILRSLYPDFDDEQIQPSGADLRLGKLYHIDKLDEGYDTGIFLKDGKEYKQNCELVEVDFDNYYFSKGMSVYPLLPNKPYIAEVNEPIKIHNKNAQFYLPRSTLLRNGVNVYTALGDLGYFGRLSFLIINHSPYIYYLSVGVRFAQLVDFQVEGSSFEYDGDYQEEDIGFYNTKSG